MTSSTARTAAPASPREEDCGRLLERWNPAVKLLSLTALSLLLLTVWQAAAPALLWAALLVAALAATPLSTRQVALSQVPFLLFALGQLTVQSVARDGAVVLDLGLLSVTEEGLRMGLAMAARTLAVGTASVVFLATTDPVRLMVSLHQNLRLPASWTYAVLAGHRLLLGLPREWAAVREAQRLRAPAAEGAPGRLTVREARSAAFALLIGAMRRAERISRSLESRGLGLRPRTVRRPVPVRWSDVVLGVGVPGLAGLGCLLTGAWG
ncbi:energy-coupling factor transporter transmembrane protein EcfT [Micrococcus sp.]|uniref:energy-coupling factor transporter transmembrane component T family protein n=1 Tax=Micrococcus sp. TaxID=1271 RepID=UPI0026DCFC49|nr:energy-coupling factor transporter transmembrane component T [Micrococcus sp.]MDO4239068.1 energy-coupling factor transporter transmembrane component T [Micrococcus sp.]